MFSRLDAPLTGALWSGDSALPPSRLKLDCKQVSDEKRSSACDARTNISAALSVASDFDGPLTLEVVVVIVLGSAAISLASKNGFVGKGLVF